MISPPTERETTFSDILNIKAILLARFKQTWAEIVKKKKKNGPWRPVRIPYHKLNIHMQRFSDQKYFSLLISDILKRRPVCCSAQSILRTFLLFLFHREGWPVDVPPRRRTDHKDEGNGADQKKKKKKRRRVIKGLTLSHSVWIRQCYKTTGYAFEAFPLGSPRASSMIPSASRWPVWALLFQP